jgi:hypothetical protein
LARFANPRPYSDDARRALIFSAASKSARAWSALPFRSHVAPRSSYTIADPGLMAIDCVKLSSARS